MSSDSVPLGRRLRRYLGLESCGDRPVERKLQDLKRRKTIRRLWLVVGVVVLSILMWVSLRMSEFSLGQLIEYYPQFVEALYGYFPPTSYFGIPFIDLSAYWAFIVGENLFGAAVVTVSIAFAGTVIGLPGALLLGVLASERVIPYPFNFLFRSIMAMIRAIPAIVWALIFIPLGGVSPFTGTLAIAVDTVGYLGRLFTDELEEIEDGPIEGIRSTGANKSQVVSFGMLSQVFRQYLAWIAFDFEHNVRVAITLGVIGAGGLGLILEIQRQTFNYTNMMACIIVIVFVAGSVELLSQRLRSYLREDDDVEQIGLLEAFRTAPRKIVESTTNRR
ncbi:phosphonate ABC transporter, permease protein PhnE [Natronorubrum aibiense]|uniref:Phosphonate ABC transporter, permease protein PhnE n=1 Tax=Natronorubrum aibiense TaxID=348826 RepID=A0A5P9P9R0_9EURY|nr:phosphonate ABC transporter, permease protein PhnE [Natronorubrum aibiense]QFU84834.1 phosphonate ABC transporter, permease protein PhnE [Natronorubrum aibiense]